MKITKIGHCCLLVEAKNVKILTDPGNFSDEQDTLSGVDAVIITHEHADHCHIPSLKSIQKNNPEAQVFANTSTAKILESEGIAHEVITEGDTLTVNGVEVKTWNTEHADIYEDITPVMNTVLLIENTLLYPGDAFYVPEGVDVHTLALPAEGPWMKTSEAIDYALAIKPEQAFPVHDARLATSLGDARYAHYKRVLEKNQITWLDAPCGSTLEC